MKITQKIIVLTFLWLVVLKSSAQQAPQFTNYIYNTMSVNPGYAGVQGRGVFNFSARKPWAGLNGSGTTQTLSYNTPLAKINELGLGANIMNDVVGPTKEITMDVNGSYKVELRHQSYLALGVKLGVSTFSFDQNSIRTDQKNDPELLEYDKKFLPAFGAGLYYYNKHFYLGASVPNLITNKDKRNKRLTYYLITGYVFDIDEDLKFKPAALLKALRGTPPTLDASLNFLVKDKLNLGISYRVADSVSALIGFEIDEKFHVGYSFDFTSSKLRIANNGTHEVFVRYNLSQIIIPRRLKCFF